MKIKERKRIKALFRTIADASGDRAGCNDYDAAQARKWNKQFDAAKTDKQFEDFLENFGDEITY